MKNLQLYQTIESLIEAKVKNKSHQKSSIAVEYCKQQMKKKKLLSFNPHSKMNRIMKYFHQLETYVSVEELLNFISKKMSEKKKEKKIQEETQRQEKNDDGIKPEYKAMKRARGYLSPFYQEKYQREGQNMKEMIKSLEKKTRISNIKFKNNHSHLEYNIYEKAEKDDLKSPKQWNLYEKVHFQMEDDYKLRQKRTEHFSNNETLKRRMQKAELIHQVSTYLQIILESIHKKKWQKKSNLPTIKEGSASHIQLRKSDKLLLKQECFHLEFNDYGRVTSYERKKQKRSTIESNYKFSEVTQDVSTTLTSPTTTPKEDEIKKVKNNFTFRNRNIKQGLLKKVDSFLGMVELEEKAIRKDNVSCLAQINKLENRIKMEYPKCEKENHVAEQEEINILKRIVLEQK